jgi:hypothetical protein
MGGNESASIERCDSSKIVDTALEIPTMTQILNYDGVAPMAAERRRSIAAFKPDYANRNPFRGLPTGFAPGHSRFPIVPCERYGDFSFDSSKYEGQSFQDRREIGLTEEEARAWRESMLRVVGHHLGGPPVDALPQR